MSPIEFGIAFAVAAGGYIVGTSLAARFVMRAGLDRTIGARRGRPGDRRRSLTVADHGVASRRSAAGLVVPMTLYLAGLGLAMPQALAGALQPFPDHAGAASSLVGFVQQTVAAVVGAVVGHLLGDRPPGRWC